MDPSILSALSRPGNLRFPSNLAYLHDQTGPGARASCLPSGHRLFYGAHGRRILATDPEGHPLHECEWTTREDGQVKLARARFRLDWGQWVGLRPEGIVNTTTLDLTKKPGWQTLQADELRRMAAQAMGVPYEEVRFFYGEDDLIIDRRGHATIRHKKDAFYVLDDETFQRARFMACMGAMHWGRIDFLPVVELFQSLLPGTGSAAFELIRGLYDDQNPGEPLPLRYRGIPTYPSEAAFRLFSGYFEPRMAGGLDPLSVFMDARRAHEVIWLPTSEQPLRYFEPARHLCVTIKGGSIQKVTRDDDPTGLSFVSAPKVGVAPCERTVRMENGLLVMQDRDERIETSVSPSWGPIRDSITERPGPCPVDWRAVFGGSFPEVRSPQSFSAVLLYPEDETEISELASQPFVADYLQDEVEESAELRQRFAQVGRVLIDNFDASLLSCINLDSPRDYTALYFHPQFAQKHAQALWSRLVRASRLDLLRRVRFVLGDSDPQHLEPLSYDLLYAWLPFAHYGSAAHLDETARKCAARVEAGGFAFIVGPPLLGERLEAYGLRPWRADSVEALPTFRAHQSILPHSRLKAGLTVFQAGKS